MLVSGLGCSNQSAVSSELCSAEDPCIPLWWDHEEQLWARSGLPLQLSVNLEIRTLWCYFTGCLYNLKRIRINTGLRSYSCSNQSAVSFEWCSPEDLCTPWGWGATLSSRLGISATLFWNKNHFCNNWVIIISSTDKYCYTQKMTIELMITLHKATYQNGTLSLATPVSWVL